MDGTVFREVLWALRSEADGAEGRQGEASWAQYAAVVDGMMRNRTLGGIQGQTPWVEQEAPYGSEFNWDTTGQEEVGVWGAYYNASSSDPHKGELQKRAVDSILAYMPSTPSFGYHGSAGGWGDFSNNAKWLIRGGWEREGGHYRAGLNSIPLIERYRSHPDQTYLLEVAMGGITGVLGNIDADGAPSMGFHLYPFMLEYDPRSGDHGLGYFGHAMNVGAYLDVSPSLGWRCYLCTLSPPQPEGGAGYAITPSDSFRARAYVAPLGLWLVLQTGELALLTVQPEARTAVAVVVPPPAGWLSSRVRLTLETPALATGRRSAHSFHAAGSVVVRDAFEVSVGVTPAGLAPNVTIAISWEEDA